MKIYRWKTWIEEKRIKKRICNAECHSNDYCMIVVVQTVWLIEQRHILYRLAWLCAITVYYNSWLLKRVIDNGLGANTFHNLSRLCQNNVYLSCIRELMILFTDAATSCKIVSSNNEGFSNTEFVNLKITKFRNSAAKL